MYSNNFNKNKIKNVKSILNRLKEKFTVNDCSCLANGSATVNNIYNLINNFKDNININNLYEKVEANILNETYGIGMNLGKLMGNFILRLKLINLVGYFDKYCRDNCSNIDNDNFLTEFRNEYNTLVSNREDSSNGILSFYQDINEYMDVSKPLNFIDIFFGSNRIIKTEKFHDFHEKLYESFNLLNNELALFFVNKKINMENMILYKVELNKNNHIYNHSHLDKNSNNIHVFTEEITQYTNAPTTTSVSENIPNQTYSPCPNNEYNFKKELPNNNSTFTFVNCEGEINNCDNDDVKENCQTLCNIPNTDNTCPVYADISNTVQFCSDNPYQFESTNVELSDTVNIKCDNSDERSCEIYNNFRENCPTRCKIVKSPSDGNCPTFTAPQIQETTIPSTPPPITVPPTPGPTQLQLQHQPAQLQLQFLYKL